MANTTIKIDSKAFEDSLMLYGANVAKDLQNNLESCVLAIERDAKMSCPVDSGRLMDSITSNVGSLEGTVGTNVEYASYVEYGTYKKAPKPYMRPAFDKNIAKLETKIKTILRG